MNVISIDISPLRERAEYTSFLVRFFIEHYGTSKEQTVARVSSEAMDLLLRYWWPWECQGARTYHRTRRGVSSPFGLCPEGRPAAVTNATVKTVA
jgi:hypothetical protein